jgi:hypothetical protein
MAVAKRQRRASALTDPHRDMAGSGARRTTVARSSRIGRRVDHRCVKGGRTASPPLRPWRPGLGGLASAARHIPITFPWMSRAVLREEPGLPWLAWRTAAAGPAVPVPSDRYPRGERAGVGTGQDAQPGLFPAHICLHGQLPLCRAGDHARVLGQQVGGSSPRSDSPHSGHRPAARSRRGLEVDLGAIAHRAAGAMGSTPAEMDRHNSLLGPAKCARDGCGVPEVCVPCELQ